MPVTVEFRKLEPQEHFRYDGKKFKKVTGNQAADARYEDDHLLVEFGPSQMVESEREPVEADEPDHQEDEHIIPAGDDKSADDDEIAPVPTRTQIHSANKDQLETWAKAEGIEVADLTAVELKTKLIDTFHPGES